MARRRPRFGTESDARLRDAQRGGFRIIITQGLWISRLPRGQGNDQPCPLAPCGLGAYWRGSTFVREPQPLGSSRIHRDPREYVHIYLSNYHTVLNRNVPKCPSFTHVAKGHDGKLPLSLSSIYGTCKGAFHILTFGSSFAWSSRG